MTFHDFKRKVDAHLGVDTEVHPWGESGSYLLVRSPTGTPLLQIYPDFRHQDWIRATEHPPRHPWHEILRPEEEYPYYCSEN